MLMIPGKMEQNIQNHEAVSSNRYIAVATHHHRQLHPDDGRGKEAGSDTNP